MDKILRGWKEIENYLNLSRKTIVAHGYPLHKGGPANSQVFAISGELFRYVEKSRLKRQGR